jgi:hypothetical protein
MVNFLLTTCNPKYNNYQRLVQRTCPTPPRR